MTCQWNSKRLVFNVMMIVQSDGGGFFSCFSLNFAFGVCMIISIHTETFYFVQFQFYYRNLSRQQAQQQAWLQKRR